MRPRRLRHPRSHRRAGQSRSRCRRTDLPRRPRPVRRLPRPQCRHYGRPLRRRSGHSTDRATHGPPVRRGPDLVTRAVGALRRRPAGCPRRRHSPPVRRDVRRTAHADVHYLRQRRRAGAMAGVRPPGRACARRRGGRDRRPAGGLCWWRTAQPDADAVRAQRGRLRRQSGAAVGAVDVLCCHIPPAVPELLYTPRRAGWRGKRRGAGGHLGHRAQAGAVWARPPAVGDPDPDRRTECVNVGHFRTRRTPYVLDWAG